VDGVAAAPRRVGRRDDGAPGHGGRHGQRVEQDQEEAVHGRNEAQRQREEAAPGGAPQDEVVGDEERAARAAVLRGRRVPRRGRDHREAAHVGAGIGACEARERDVRRASRGGLPARSRRGEWSEVRRNGVAERFKWWLGHWIRVIRPFEEGDGGTRATGQRRRAQRLVWKARD